MIKSNIHTHTIFSDGKHTPEQNAESAILKGFSLLGFSDHSYLPFDNSYTIKTDSYDDYINTIRRLQTEYQDRITIKLGLEMDVDSVADLSAYDYIIGAAHNVNACGAYYAVDSSEESQRRVIQEAFDGNTFDYCRAYFENVCRAVKMRPNVLAHFDLITKFGIIDTADPKYKNLASEAIDEVLNFPDVLIEVNTGAMSRGYRNLPYPEDYIIRRIKERKGKIIIGSDSHNLNNLDYAFPVAIAQIKKAGINSVYQLLPEGFTETEI